MKKVWINYMLPVSIFFIPNVCPAPDEPPCPICALPAGNVGWAINIGGLTADSALVIADLLSQHLHHPIGGLVTPGSRRVNYYKDSLLADGDTLLLLDDYAEILRNAAKCEESYLAAYQGLQVVFQEIDIPLYLPELPDQFNAEENYILWDNYFLWVEYLTVALSYIDHKEFVEILNGELECDFIYANQFTEYYDACEFLEDLESPSKDTDFGEDTGLDSTDAGVSADTTEATDWSIDDIESLLWSTIGFTTEDGYATNDQLPLWEPPTTE